MSFDLGLEGMDETRSTQIDEFDMMFLMSIVISGFFFVYIFLFVS